MDEFDIVKKAQSGDLDAFSELVRRYQGSVRASLAVRLSNRHEADDLAQEAFIIAFRKLHTFDTNKAFGPWIRSIAFNLLRNYWRKHKAIAVGDAAELDMMIDQQINLGYSSDNEAERLSLLKRCIAKLDQPMQELLRLRYFEEISVREISRSLKLKHSTVTMRLHRLREGLFTCMKGQTKASLMLTREQEQLVAAYLEGEAVSKELLVECHKDPKVLNHLADLVAMDRLLQLTSPEASGEAFTDELRERLGAKSDPQFEAAISGNLVNRRRHRMQWRGALAAAACLAFAGLLFLMLRPEAAFGQVLATRDIVWSGSSLMPGDSIRENRLRIAHGYSEILLNNGVTLLLEGPAELEFVSDDTVRLHEGSLVANVPEPAIGFTVDTPNSKVVYLGTVFGMSVALDGSSEVHVLEGEVKARPLRDKDFTHLVTNEALMIDPQQQVTAIRSNPDRFRRALPGRSATNPEYLHWSFDQESAVAESGGTSIDGMHYPGKLMALNDGEGPVYQNGQFGEALYFNGVDAYVATDFPGIGGNRPRTIAFWAKIPRDFSVRNGYGMLGWGLFERGAGWQISPNPTAKEGPLGRLRIGTVHAPIIGTTDLRDNRWHHIAIVMYGGEAADLSTHVLLYIDGNLENTSIKSVAHIDTQLDHEDSLPLMFGRNIRFGDDSSPVDEQFFRGWIDEAFIFDTALNQNQIKHLMRTNQWAGASTGD